MQLSYDWCERSEDEKRRERKTETEMEMKTDTEGWEAPTVGESPVASRVTNVW